MSERVFLDSNLWIYAFVEAEDDREKRRTVLELLESLSKEHEVVVSAQVVNETHWILYRKYAVEEEGIRQRIAGLTAVSEVFPLTLKDYQAAYSLRMDYSLSFWDSLIVAVALKARCTLLYSEDMQDNLLIRGSLRIRNPFMESLHRTPM